MGEPIVFGATPLVAAEGLAPSGEYIVGLLVENVAGDISDEYVDISVTNDEDALAQDDFVPAGVDQGAQPGTLLYIDAELGLRFEYPMGWELADTGSDKIVLYEQGATIATYVSIDIAMFDEVPEVANQAMLDELLSTAENEPDFEQRGDVEQFDLAGLDGIRLVYHFSGEDEVIQVTAIAVTSPDNAQTYLFTMETPQSEVDSKGALFEQMLATIDIGDE